MEYFDESWKKRIFQMSKYIEAKDSVVDYGCGKMWLREYLTKDNSYVGVDYQKRDDTSIVCDFNKNEFPQIKSTVAFISGCLEYIEDPKWFLKNISEYHQKCIISYCSTDYFNDYQQRKLLGWKNNLSDKELIDLFAKENMTLVERDITPTKNRIFYFKRSLI